MLSPVRLSSVSITFVRRTQLVEILAMFLGLLVHWPSVDIHGKFYGDRPKGIPPSAGLNGRGVAKYSAFGAFGRHILETVQDRRQVSVNH